MRSARKVGVAVCAAALLGAAVAAPAGAADITSPTASGSYTGVLTGGAFEVAYQCDARAPGAVAVVLECTLNGGSQTISMPGSAAVWGGVAQEPIGPIQLCWRVTAIYTDASERTIQGCAASPIGGGVGATH